METIRNFYPALLDAHDSDDMDHLSNEAVQEAVNAPSQTNIEMMTFVLICAASILVLYLLLKIGATCKKHLYKKMNKHKCYVASTHVMPFDPCISPPQHNDILHFRFC